MVEGYLIIDGVPSTNYGIYVSKSNMFDSASEDVDTIEVSGRNGALHISNDRFKSFTAVFECYCKNNANLANFRNFLQSKKANVKIVDSNNQNEYRIGRYTDKFALDEFNPNASTFVLKFVCKPERWLTSGDNYTTLTASGTITNPSVWSSKPLLRVYGSGTITFGGQSIVVSTTASDIYIDCESMNCYNGTTNYNNSVSVNEFPTLASGENNIEISGFTKVMIKPRWWQL